MARAAFRKSLKVEAIIDNAPDEAQVGFHASLRREFAQQFGNVSLGGSVELTWYFMHRSAVWR